MRARSKTFSVMLVFSLVSLTVTTLRPNPSSATTSPPTGVLSNVKQVATGSAFACALLSNGTVDCWGNNLAGQLGNGTFSYQDPNPEPVPGLSQVKQLAAGTFASCALLSNSSVDCWGTIYPLTVSPSDDSVDTPVPVPGLPGVKALGAGAGFTCALMVNQTVECWGENTNGTIGSAEPAFATSPVLVPKLRNVAQLAVGEFESCALLDNRTVQCWGDDRPLTPIRKLSNVTSVATGNGTSCAVLKGGTVKCWGNNVSDQLLTPNPLTASSSIPVTATGLSHVRVVTLGQTNGCALLAKGTVECWGDNQLQGTYYGGPTQGLSFYPYPYQVVGLANVTHLSTGIGDGVSQFTCALLRDTSVKCWGFNYDGELGHGTTGNVMVPTSVVGVANATQISAGADHTCALLLTGSIDCWGLDMFGELGNGARADSAKPLTVPGVSGATEVSAGEFDTCGLLGGGTVKCWGLNAQGELGDGHISTPPLRPGPVLVTGLSNATQISVGWTSACALLNSGTVKCWGDNSEGQLGTGNLKQSSSPVQVVDLSGVTQVVVGNDDSCALLSNGTVECWGSGSSGQLGNGTYVDSPLPVAVQGLTGVIQISLGDSSACALLNTGTDECWGNDFEDQLGNFEAATGGESGSTPVVVAQIAGATSVASGGQTSCTLTAAPSLACWGYSSYFQYPSIDGNSGDWSPTTITTISGISQISLGEYHVCALLKSGGIECWGDDFDGQDGNGVLGYSVNPVWVSSVVPNS